MMSTSNPPVLQIGRQLFSGTGTGMGMGTAKNNR